jgi:hypothetical protein
VGKSNQNPKISPPRRGLLVWVAESQRTVRGVTVPYWRRHRSMNIWDL